MEKANEDFVETEDYKPVNLSDGVVPGEITRERAARAQKKRNDVILSGTRNTMVIPGGAVIDVGEYMAHRYDFRKNWWIGDPRPLLKDPKPQASGYTYAWPRRVDAKGKDVPETSALIRQGRYRPIAPSEIEEHTGGAVTSGEGVNKDKVYWGDLLLVEVRPDQRRAQYDAPVAVAMTRLSNYEETLADDVEHISRGKAVLDEFHPEGEAHIDGRKLQGSR